MGQFTLAAPLPWADRWRAPAPLRRVHGMDAVADLIASPGAPAAWDNSGKLASAAIASGRLRWTGKSGAGDNCDYTTGAFTAPIYKLPLDVLHPTQQCSVAVHFSSPSAAGPANYEMAGILLREQDNPTTNGYWAECLFGRTGAGGGATGYQIRYARAIGGAPVGVGAHTDIADLTGAWIRMTITPTGIVHFDYRLTTDRTYPGGSQWTSYADTAQVFGLTNELNLEVCLMMIAVTDPPSGRVFDFNEIVFNYGGGPA